MRNPERKKTGRQMLRKTIAGIILITAISLGTASATTPPANTNNYRNPPQKPVTENQQAVKDVYGDKGMPGVHFKTQTQEPLIPTAEGYREQVKNGNEPGSLITGKLSESWDTCLEMAHIPKKHSTHIIIGFWVVIGLLIFKTVPDKTKVLKAIGILGMVAGILVWAETQHKKANPDPPQNGAKIQEIQKNRETYKEIRKEVTGNPGSTGRIK